MKVIRIKKAVTLNTSNPGKLREFQEYLGDDLQSTSVDLREVDSDSETVVVYKAKHAGDNILIEDTSLEIEGANVGANIKWLLGNLDKFVGRKATWLVYLAMKSGDKINLWKGEVRGTITEPKGQGFGFDPYFMPEGSNKTLGENKPADYNARALAIQNYKTNNVYKSFDIPNEWQGDWQNE